MQTLSQAHRFALIHSVLPDDTLILHHLEGREQLGTLPEYRLTAVSDNDSLPLIDLLGTPIAMTIDLDDGCQREVAGHVCEARQVDAIDGYPAYRLHIRPWTWFLTRTRDSRIFQDMTVPEILQQIVAEEGLGEVDVRLTGSYEKWHYCVQYQETDFAFISRLMEREGIFYLFDHRDGKCRLVLVDDNATLTHRDGCETVIRRLGDARPEDNVATIHSWQQQLAVMPGKVSVTDFGFASPGDRLAAQAASPATHEQASHDWFEHDVAYPVRITGEKVRDFGAHVASLRQQALHAQHAVVWATGTAGALEAGYVFTPLDDHGDGADVPHLVLSTQFDIRTGFFDDATHGGKPVVRVEFTAMELATPYRMAPTTPWPRITGPQTAIVVGKPGEEIWTDKYGRVKLHFHWDRLGCRDETGSCWVRVSQLWAGSGFGGMHIPRIGQEVIVEFIDGDPDQPIVTGRVYNGDNPVPFALPANATQSGIRSRSSPGGGTCNGNELRMEDKHGAEEFFLQAERDLRCQTKRNRSESVGGDSSLSVGGSQHDTITRDLKIELTEGDYRLDILKGTHGQFIKGMSDIRCNDVYGIFSVGEMSLESSKKITLKSGASSIVLEADGTITVKGKTLKFDASGELDAKGGSVKIASQSTATFSGIGKVDIAGASVVVNG